MMNEVPSTDKSSKSFLSSPLILMELGKKPMALIGWPALHVWARVLFFLSSEARGPAFSPYLLQLMQPTYLKVGRYSRYFTCVPHPFNQS